VLRSTLDRDVSPPKFDHVKRIKIQIEQSTEVIRDMKVRIDNAKRSSMNHSADNIEQIRAL
jgi:hypothetical protein